MTQWVFPLFGGLGLGSLLTTFVQSLLNKKSALEYRAFIEKREAYVGLQQAIFNAAVVHNDETAMAYGYWEGRVEMVGSPMVIRSALFQDWVVSKGFHIFHNAPLPPSYLKRGV